MRKLMYITGLMLAMAAVSACKGHNAHSSGDTAQPVKAHRDTNNGGGMNVPVAGQDTTGRTMPAGDTSKKHK